MSVDVDAALVNNGLAMKLLLLAVEVVGLCKAPPPLGNKASYLSILRAQSTLAAMWLPLELLLLLFVGYGYKVEGPSEKGLMPLLLLLLLFCGVKVLLRFDVMGLIMEARLVFTFETKSYSTFYILEISLKKIRIFSMNQVL